MTFMKKLLAPVAFAVLGASAAQAEELKLADFLPATHPFQEKVWAVFANDVAERTNGEVTIRVYPGGELGPGPVEQYNRVVDGLAELAYALPGYTASNFPKLLLTELPGVITEETGTKAVLDNIDMLDEEFRRAQLIGYWSNGANLLFTAEKPVRSLEDIKGLKLRVPSRNAGLMVESWGATPVSMPVSEIYNSMQTGVIDGAMIDGTATFVFKLAEVTKYITTGMDSSISSFFLIMNKDAFADLTEEQQQAMLDAGRDLSFLANAQQLSDVEKGLEMFGNTEGKELIELSPEAVAEFNAASAPVLDAAIADAESQGIDARGFIDALAASK
ncbi:TRAP transporter substrate-binding protein [Sinisalibacter aestuarii]|uniref:C4-dicarboxylate ABC transporter substrate-binding protein n=1 Tax=Sinisalibacter aestuarii TaxID=2949426 RepID=A0ABQ5LY98_9RHOB|nr:TRAP transporter substrate-binding protein [Sinisalibacter aestuarii]GKY89929.1 C4-dicarboxylate ABC transporter substrate-binding protein [Sinisalibacter aestuarii]